MGELRVMGESGDVKVEWNPDVEVEVEMAEKAFKENTKKGYKAFRIDVRAKKGEELDKFDKWAERILFVPPMAGG